MSGAAVNLILEKIGSKDKDFRYMAASDLLAELSREAFRVDPDLERRLAAAVAAQLEDASGDVSGLAVKCLSLLVRRVSEATAVAAVADLCAKAAGAKKEATRDMAGIALKTVVQELPPGHRLAGPVGGAMVEGLVKGVQAGKDATGVASDCLDVLAEAAGAFGGHLQAMHQQLLTVLLDLMGDPRPAVRKRALHALAAASPHLSDALLGDAAGALLARLEAEAGAGKPSDARVYVQALGSVARAAGHRLGGALPRALPLAVRTYRGAQEGEDDDELRDACLQALEAFVSRCGGEARPFVGDVLGVALAALRHDPNFADDMDDGGGQGGSDDEDAGGSDEDEYSDDEDVSWKVRRAAAKLIAAVVAAYPDAVADTYQRCAGDLVSRFREREESVKGGVMAAYCDLVKQVCAASRHRAPDDPASPLAALRADTPAALKAAAQQLGGRDVKTRAAALGVLRALGGAAPQEVAQQLGLIVPGLLSALGDKAAAASALKVEALALLQPLLAGCEPALVAPHLERLGAGVFGAVGERYYKVSAEALRACEWLVRTLRPAPSEPPAGAAVKLVAPLLQAVEARLAGQDQDQEVKEAAIMAAAAVVASLGDQPAVEGQVGGLLQTLLERMRNETTRLPAVRALAAVAASPLPLPALAGEAAPAVAELTGFLRKANRPLRAASLVALEALCSRGGLGLEPGAFAAAVSEAPTLLSDTDLSLAAEALSLYAALARGLPGTADELAGQALPAALELARSQLLQGAALEALQRFLSALAGAGAGGAAARGALIDALLRDLRARDAGAQAHESVARCVAVLACGDPAPGPGGVPAAVDTTVTQLLALAVDAGDAAGQRLALLCIGQIGRRLDGVPLPAAEAAVLAALSGGGEDARGAASVALGGLVAGDLGRSLPKLCSMVQGAGSEPTRQYLLLQALHEVLSALVARAASAEADAAARRRSGAAASASGGGGAAPALDAGQVGALLELLLRCAQGGDECATVVADCLGQLALLAPEQVVGALADALPGGGPAARCAAAGAVKSMMSPQGEGGAGARMALEAEAALAGRLGDFLGLIADGDLRTRKAAVLALSSVSHHRPRLAAPHLPALLPLLYAQTEVRPELIRTVDLGPFKHKIDDGLDLRKAAFECLDILLDSTPAALDPGAFLACLTSGLGDHPDVKAPAHHMLARTAAAAPGAVLAQLDALVDPLEKTLTAKVKSDAVKQDLDRHEESLRSCLRAVDALDRLPGAPSNPKWPAFMGRTPGGPALRERLAAVRAERDEAGGAARAPAA